MSNGFNVIGKPVQRLDSMGHVTGRTVFMEDMNPQGMLYLKMHRSERHHALLAENPRPTREDVVRAISGNVCRCTGYESIIRAILDAADRINA